MVFQAKPYSFSGKGYRLERAGLSKTEMTEKAGRLISETRQGLEV